MTELDGVSLDQLMLPTAGGLTYNDFLILPGNYPSLAFLIRSILGYIDFSSSDVSLVSKVTKNHSLCLPLLSSPMDTVTGNHFIL